MKNLTNVKQRISYYIDNLGIGITKFYKESGVTYGVLSQKSNLSEDNIVKFLTRYAEVSPDWLLLGQGEMFRGNFLETPVNQSKQVERLEKQVDDLMEMNKNLIEANKMLARRAKQ